MRKMLIFVLFILLIGLSTLVVFFIVNNVDLVDQKQDVKRDINLDTNKIELEEYNLPEEYFPTIQFRKYDSAIDLLKECPTEDEINQINRDFNLIWEFTPDQYECTKGGNESNHKLTVYNVFRTYKALPSKKFKWMENYDNAYDWLKSLDLEIHLKNSGMSMGGGNFIFVNVASWNGEYRRVEYIPKYGNGFPWTLTIFMHEARHTKAGGGKTHTCGLIDQNLAELGAFAVHYQWEQHLVNSGFFSDTVKPNLIHSARLTLEKSFCE